MILTFHSSTLSRFNRLLSTPTPPTTSTSKAIWLTSMKSNLVKAINTSHTVYTNAIPIRISVHHGIDSFQLHATHVYRLTKENFFAYKVCPLLKLYLFFYNYFFLLIKFYFLLNMDCKYILLKIY